MARFLEPDIGTRAYRLATGVNEAVMTAANEPSLGLYRLQEHCISNIPKLLKERQSIEEISTRVKGNNFDLTYDIEAVKEMGKVDNFSTVISDLSRAIKIKEMMISREMEQRTQGRGVTPPRTLPSYGSTGESPPLLRRSDGYSINAPSRITTPPTYHGTQIQPKNFK